MKIKDRFKRKIKDFLGISSLEESIDSLYYFFNEYVSIENFPKAKGELRELQKCDTLLLAILDKIFVKHNLTYWLSFGTLLGAIRHNGFIPWDDDLDIAMPKNDYNKVQDIITKEFKQYGLDGFCEINPGTKSFGVGIMHQKTGIYCDIFPFEEFFVDINSENQLPALKIEALKIFNKKNKNRLHFHINNKEGFNNYYCYSPFASESPVFYSHKDIFPLKKFSFENFEFFVPNNYEKFLVDSFGNDYMQFPKFGILHHGSKELPLYKWASISNTDLKKVFDELNSCLAKLNV